MGALALFDFDRSEKRVETSSLSAVLSMIMTVIFSFYFSNHFPIMIFLQNLIYNF